MKRSRMFSAVTKTWNPLVIHPCPHSCVYCWTGHIVRRFRLELYLRSNGRPILLEARLRQVFPSGSFVFFCDMADCFAEAVPDDMVLRCLEAMRRQPWVRFLLLTKNPLRFVEMLDVYGPSIFSKNMVFGTTVETLNDALYRHHSISRAPPPSLRLQALARFVKAMEEAAGWRPQTFVSIEPIIFEWSDRDINVLTTVLSNHLRPIMVYVGYDNYRVLERLRIPEPRLETTRRLIARLREQGINVVEKTIRFAWNEV